MGTKVHCKSYLPGDFSMRDLNEDSSSSSWPPLFYGDKTATSGQYFNGFIPRTTIDDYSGYEKDTLKQKMLEHETVFRNQVYELHRLYRIQRDMMEEVKRKNLHEQEGLVEPSSSSNLQGSQMPSEDAQKWHMAGIPLSNSGLGRTTILGVEIVNSPMSSTKGNNARQSQFSVQNGFPSDVCEASNSRPLKVRKMLFDLQLPAEEYADTEEGGNLLDYKVSDMSSYAPDENPKTPPNGMKLFVGNCAGVKVDSQIDASASSSCFRGSTVLADLNEPLMIEESMAPFPCNIYGHAFTIGGTKGMNQSAKSNGRYLGAVHDGFLINSSVESKVNERGWLSHVSEAGYSKSNLNSLSQGFRQDKFLMHSHQVQGMLNQVNHSSGTYRTVCSREDVQRDSSFYGTEFSDRNIMHQHENHPAVLGDWNPLRSSAEQADNRQMFDHSYNCHLQSIVASQNPDSHPFFNSPCFTSSLAHSVSSWAKPKNGFTKIITPYGSPFISAAETDRSSLPPAQSREPLGGKWQANASSRTNAGFGSEGTMVNGFCHGVASGSKKPIVHISSPGFENLNCSRRDELPVRSMNQVFGTLAHVDLKPALDINLNEVISSSSNEPLILQNLDMKNGKGKPEDQLSALHWPRPKPVHGIELDWGCLQASSCQRETIQDLNQPYTPEVMLASNNCQITVKKEINATHNVKKILGVPIFEYLDPKEEPSSFVSPSTIVDCPSEKKHVDQKRKNRIIDINLECEPDEQMADEEMAVEKRTKSSCFIDLNSCVSDCEDPPAPSLESMSGSIKVILEIDLEAPVFPDSEGDDTPCEQNNMEKMQDDALRNAADTLVSISSSCPHIQAEDSVFRPSESSLADSVLWFIDAVSSCAVELESKSVKESRSKDASQQEVFYDEMDEFEAMILQLEDTKEEDFMPKPFIPEAQIEHDEGFNSLATRSRRGQSRRGRQRRDFQRDILPGLTSLSRHEVTEDLQTFGGMMRATGHNWNSGLTRRNGTRNGGARGRRRAVTEPVITVLPSTVCTPFMKPIYDIEAGLEDRSLTGWGKTTRRPRRQRCPAGNPHTVVALTE